MPGTVVISQVYGGGGNSSATFQNDYVELFNRSAATVSISGWSVQYASATSTGNFASNVATLSGSLAPGQYYLVKLASGGATGAALPAADATATGINMAAGAGKVVLVDTSAGLACNGGSTACSSSDAAHIMDLVGYGTANFFEGASAAPGPANNTTAIFRAFGGCTDTDNNGADFSSAIPNPRDSASTFNVCAAPTPTPTPTPSPTPTPTPTPAPFNSAVKISQVYGGGGNSGSTYTNDFIELYNTGSAPVDVTGWSVQYTSSTAAFAAQTTPTPPATATPLTTTLAGTIQPGHYYLIQESQGAGGTTGLPTPDLTGGIAMGSSAGKVALVASSVVLNGGTAGNCPTDPLIVDFVGYNNTASCFEGAPTLPLTNTTAAIRKNDGCTDTDNNANDFLVDGPIPRNSSSPANRCGGDATQISGIGLATPDSLLPSSNVLLTVNVSPASVPPSTGVTVQADLTSIGGSATQQFYDDGTHGDQTAGDNIYTFQATIGAFIPTGAKTILATITDAQSRTATAPITLTVQSPTCGVERWSVKTGTDPDAPLVDLNNPVPTTIANLRALTPPSTPPDNARVAPAETTVYVIKATMTLYKLETDVDYHIVVQDDNGNTIVTEIPCPCCIGTGSPFAAAVAKARAAFDAKLSVTPFFQSVSIPVQITGVGFFDFIHGQTGVAPNGIELHPILDIKFLNTTTTTLASNVNPSQFGQPVTITATVASSGSSTPTGNVAFSDGANVISSSAVNAQGQASFTSSTLSVGSHQITAAYAGDGSSVASTSAALSQVVNKGDQFITFGPLGAKTFGDADFNVSANASSNLLVSFSIASGPATISGNTVHITGAGTVTVRASQGGDGNYNPAPDVDQPFDVSRAGQTITFGALPGKTYGDAPFAVTATGGGSGHPVTFSASGNCTSGGTNGSTITITGAGSCNVTASQVGDTNYNAAQDVPRSFTINQATASVTVNGYTGAYDGKAHGAAGSATGVGGEDLSSLLNLGATFTNVPGGSAHWTFAGNVNYAATAGDATITITQATANVTVNGYTGGYDGNAHGATGSATGLNGESLTSLLNLGQSFTNVPGGSAHWTFAGNTNYAASAGEAPITITQAAANITVNGYTGVYNGSAHGATGSAQGVNAEDLTNLLDLGASFTDVPGGTAHWTFAGNTNYAPSSGNAAIMITQATASITVNGYTGVYDGGAHGASGAATGVNGENLTGLLNLGATFTSVPGGTAHWSFAGNSDYAPASGNATITITRATPTITWSNPGDMVFGTPLGAAQLNAVASAPGALTYTPSPGTVLGAGASQALMASFMPTDTTNYAPTSKNVLINVVKATPAFSSLSSPTIGCGAATVSASGRISFGSFIPTGSVAITLNGVTQNAPVQPNGSFSAAFSTASLTPANSPLSIAFGYAGDGNFNSATGGGTLTIVDTVAPTITLNGNSISLWPDDHSYRTVSVGDLVAGASDSCDPGVTLNSVVISQVTSDEGTIASGDIVIGANCRSVQLRVARDGNGDGRVYTITFRVRDAAGNTTTASAKVTVPHDQGNGSNAVDSGPTYSVAGNCP